ncbi:hypothetical protein TNCV_4660481 [Trichonephila clavipes]|uniref:Uncharacterized protein n=1 Tax=Trichonephila clavipes TaxID=2585209 RepID=A0A8X6VK22_TRICX|nr:hypothetical protein TNCV_4660481 [Trichonephila clavipes]
MPHFISCDDGVFYGYGYVYHGTTHETGTHLKRRQSATPVASFIVVRPTIAMRFYAAVSGKTAINVAMQTVQVDA